MNQQKPKVNKFQTAIALTRQPVLDEAEDMPIMPPAAAVAPKEEQIVKPQLNQPAAPRAKTAPVKSAGPRRRASKVSSGRSQSADYEAITLGNIFTSPLLKVWEDDRYTEFRRRFHTDDPVDCCRRCGTDWSL